MRAEIESFLARFSDAAEPGFNGFAEFLPSLPLEQQYNVVRFCVHRDISPNEPVWIIFALAQQLWVRSVKGTQDAAALLETKAAGVAREAVSLTADAKQAAEDARKAIEALKRTPVQIARDREAIRSDLSAALTAERSHLTRTATAWWIWGVFSILLVAATLAISFPVAHQAGLNEGYQYVQSAVRDGKREMLDHLLQDRRLRTSPAWRRIIQERLNSL